MVKVIFQLQLEKVLELGELLWKYKDIFAWTYKDLNPSHQSLFNIKLNWIQPYHQQHQAKYMLNANYATIVKQEGVVTIRWTKKGVRLQKKNQNQNWINIYVFPFKAMSIMGTYFFIHMNFKEFKPKIHLMKF